MTEKLCQLGIQRRQGSDAPLTHLLADLFLERVGYISTPDVSCNTPFFLPERTHRGTEYPSFRQFLGHTMLANEFFESFLIKMAVPVYLYCCRFKNAYICSDGAARLSRAASAETGYCLDSFDGLPGQIVCVHKDVQDRWTLPGPFHVSTKTCVGLQVDVSLLLNAKNEHPQSGAFREK